MQVGVIGLGNIGGHVAANLVTDGHEVMVFDVDRERADAITGADAVASVAEVGVASEITMLSLPTPAVVRRVADEWVTTAASGAVLVDLSTNSPEVVRELGAATRLERAPPGRGAAHRGRHRRREPHAVVHGRRRRRRRRTGAAGPRTARPCHVHLGPLGLGNTMKLVNSLIAFTTTWVSLEGLSLAAKSGIPVPRAVEVLRTDGVANFYLDRMVEGIDTRNGPTQFALELAAKDTGLIVETGRRLGVPTPPARRCSRCSWARSPAGLGDHDWSDLVTAAERQGDVELHWNTPSLTKVRRKYVV